MRFVEEQIPDSFADLIIFINKDFGKRETYRKYIFQFHDNWIKNKVSLIPQQYGKYIWGSKVLVPAHYRVDEVFTDRIYGNALEFFTENDIKLISDISELYLLKLMNHPMIGYNRFLNVLYTLFIIEYKNIYRQPEEDTSRNTSYVNIDTPSANEEIQNSKNVAEENTTNNDGVNEDSVVDIEEIAIINPENINDDNIIEDIILDELLNFSNSLKENLEKGHEIILRAKDSYLNSSERISILESENLDLRNQIEKANIESDFQIKKLERKLKDEAEEKEKLKILIDDISNSYEAEVQTLSGNFKDYRQDKESEMEALKQILSQMKIEREEDKKVLDEFENMIKIIDKIKGIFGRE